MTRNVSPDEHPLGVDRAIFLFLSKKVLMGMAVPLITQGDLAHMVDERWILALQLWILLPVLALSTAELLWGISKICTEIAKMELISTILIGNQHDNQISNGQKGMKAELSVGILDGCNSVYKIIKNLPPSQICQASPPMGSFLPENWALRLMQYR